MGNNGTDACISVNELTRDSGYQTMRVMTLVGKPSIFVLIDSWSTHNFLSQETLDKLGCVTVSIPSKVVLMADGNKIVCQSSVQNFYWMMQDRSYQDYVLMIPLASCDMVLVIQWLDTLCSVWWDFK